MRRSFMLILVVAVAASASTAAPASPQTMLAIRAGASIATMAHENPIAGVEIGSRRGIAVGASVTHYLARNIGIRLGGTFASKGAEASLQGETDVLRINYVELSPLFDIRAVLAEGDREVSLDLLLGPTVSLKRSCENDPPAGGATARCEDLELKIATVDVGATVGAGLQLQVVRDPFVALSVEARYTHGLREVQTENDRNAGKNRAYLIQAGISFPIG